VEAVCTQFRFAERAAVLAVAEEFQLFLGFRDLRSNLLCLLV
jgi:hypothetical protein